jgi:hypothetical protein
LTRPKTPLFHRWIEAKAANSEWIICVPQPILFK